MKLKSFVTATLALGLLSTVGAALPSHEHLQIVITVIRN